MPSLPSPPFHYRPEMITIRFAGWISCSVVLSSRCGLNMKHFQTLEYSQEMTLMTEKKSQEEEPEV